MILYLHVPHTCGRSIRRALFIKDELKKIGWVHNSSQIKDLKTENISTKYFVLRDPIERIIGEFKHYSKNLKSIGIVNHLNLNNLLRENEKFDTTSILDYCSLEVNRNVYCKFLLLRDDFNVPISEKDFDSIIQNNNFKFDVYSFPLKLPVLSSLLGFEINPHVIVNNSNKNDTINKIDAIKKLKEYDLRLYNCLKSI